MARARSTVWLAIPMALAVGAVAWLLLSAGKAAPGGGLDSDGASRDGDAAPEEAAASGGSTLAKGDPARPK